MQKRFGLFLILSSLIVFTPSKTSIYACGYDPDTEELRFMIFNPDLMGQKSWWTFFYSAQTDYMDRQYAGIDDENVLVDEWIKQTKSSAAREEVYQCVFGSLSDSALQENKFYRDLKENKKLEEYFLTAREIEAVSKTEGYSEDGGEEYGLAEEQRLLISRASSTLSRTSDPFLAKKYAFQILKLAYYSGRADVFNSTYNRYFKGKTMHVLDWWALHFKSMQLEVEQKRDSANFLHARVFSHSSNKKLVSKQFFSREGLDTLLALAQTAEDRADILTLAEVINPGQSLAGITYVYEQYPQHSQLPLLITREINKLEDWLGTTKFMSQSSVPDRWSSEPVMTNWERDFQYLEEFTETVTAMADLEANQPAFFHLSVAYLNLMRNDPATANEHLEKVTINNPKLRWQTDVLKVVSVAQSKDIRQESTQNEIGELLTDLVGQRKDIL